MNSIVILKAIVVIFTVAATFTSWFITGVSYRLGVSKRTDYIYSVMVTICSIILDSVVIFCL